MYIVYMARNENERQSDGPNKWSVFPNICINNSVSRKNIRDKIRKSQKILLFIFETLLLNTYV
jgi:hypothetical protein